jgi:hypothetical protein
VNLIREIGLPLVGRQRILPDSHLPHSTPCSMQWYCTRRL